LAFCYLFFAPKDGAFWIATACLSAGRSGSETSSGKWKPLFRFDNATTKIPRSQSPAAEEAASIEAEAHKRKPQAVFSDEMISPSRSM